jgi:predicted RNA-binding Zn-ribbon protein involved in translation (DUF1610 family)
VSRRARAGLPRLRSWAVPGLAGLLFVLLGALLLPASAWARPGGGESYSGPSGDGGGGDDGGGCVFLLLRLWLEFVIRYPAIGVPMTILMVIGFLIWKKRGGKLPQRWDSTALRTAPAPTAPPARPRSRDLDALRERDPQFSAVLFEDFVTALFARAHQSRSDAAALAGLAPYLGEAARQHLAGRQPVGAPVSGVVIGAVRVRDVVVPQGAQGSPGTDPQSQVMLEIEANLTLAAGGPEERTHYVQERWRLVRAAGVLSKPREQVKTFSCPNCGAPFSGAAGGGRCEYCGQVVTDGRFDWSVAAIDLLRIEERPPALTGTVAETGTSFPTVFHPRLAAAKTELLRDDPTATDQALGARVRLIHAELNAGWTALDLKPVRPYVSENLIHSLQYWIDAYRRQGLRNVLEGTRVVDLVLVKVTRDRAYDAVTYRVWGSGKDSTVREATGDVVAGDRGKDRVYSEYWTLIRGAGVRGAPRADKNCPNCGAPLVVNMAGRCEHCDADVASGDFDWVLSKIEQDDAYTG